MIVNQNSEFLFLFEAQMTNANGDPDQENKPRMDYETSTALVSDVRRKRDCRDILKQKGFAIFVDTLPEGRKIPMDKMFEYIIDKAFKDQDQMNALKKICNEVGRDWLLGDDSEKYSEVYKKNKKTESNVINFNNWFLTEIIKKSLIDIRLFGSAMAVEGISRTYTGPVQMNWGYSLHPVELLKSNTITTIMNDDSSTFGKQYKLHYGLIGHYGTVNKYSAIKTGMTEEDLKVFRKALVQGMMNNQTNSKQGQTPLMYLELIYKPDFDGYVGDLRRFLKCIYNNEKPIRKLDDIKIDFISLTQAISEMKKLGYLEKVIGWIHPFVFKNEVERSNIFFELPEYESIDLWKPIEVVG
mgnify:CR=1 FL=1|jgi:CRISPR-associated protein Csh2